MRDETKALLEDLINFFVIADGVLAYEQLSYNDLEQIDAEQMLRIITGAKKLIKAKKISISPDFIKSLNVTEQDTKLFLKEKEKNARRKARKDRKGTSPDRNAETKKP